MSEFLDVLTHGRRLQGAVKELSLEELNTVVTKLQNIISVREEKEAEKIKAEQEKQAKIDAIKKQMEEAGLDLGDLQGIDAASSNNKRGKKRPVKYILKDSAGNEHPWTGIGRMPKVFSEALASGKSLDDYSV